MEEKTVSPMEGRPEGMGKLKIFFGYAAGVGKTYAMLDTAREDQKAGADVVAGYVEAHARPDTLALLEGLEMLSPKYADYKGIRLREFDLDAALKRRPKILLIDELAHTNSDQCRHKKRWQDVEELLEAGIDVYTTVNVQHLESLYDIVASITQVRVRERIPDTVFDQADKIELVDIEPEELLKRLEAGKIYKKQEAGQAMKHFFTKENLTALREIALRRTADQVNRAVIRQREKKGREYYTGEHILVCISSSPANEKVIRTAARMADAFRAKLTAIVVERPEEGGRDEKQRLALEGNVSLARQFHAEVAVVYGQDIAEQIGAYAGKNGVSKIVIGRTVRQSGPLAMLSKKKALIDRLIKRVPGMDVYVIPDVKAKAMKRRPFLEVYGKKQNVRETAMEFLLSGFLLFLATIIAMAIEGGRLGETNEIMAYILAIIVISGFCRRRITGIAASAAAVLLFNFFFTVPHYTFQATASEYPFTFFTMLLCALMVNSLAGRLKAQVGLLKEQSEKMQILIDINRKLKIAEDEDEILDICAKQVKNLLERNVVVYREESGALTGKRIYPASQTDPDAGMKLREEEEEAVAVWVYKNSHKAGAGTGTLPGAAGLYLPVKSDGEVYGVVGIELKGEAPIGAADRNVLNVLLNETAAACKEYRLKLSRP